MCAPPSHGGVYIYVLKTTTSQSDAMKETLLVFGSIVAVLLGLALLYVNLYGGNISEVGYLIGDTFGILSLAAGLTGAWAVRRFRR